MRNKSEDGNKVTCSFVVLYTGPSLSLTFFNNYCKNDIRADPLQVKSVKQDASNFIGSHGVLQGKNSDQCPDKTIARILTK